MTVSDMIIRPETPEDLDAVHLLNRQAFGQEAEAALVDRLRDGVRGRVDYPPPFFEQ